MSDSVQENYSAMVTTLRALGDALIPAVAARWEAPPSGTGGGGEVPNPTLDTVLDPRRMALSIEVARTSEDLRRAFLKLEPHVVQLRRAVARWEGSEDVPA